MSRRLSNQPRSNAASDALKTVASAVIILPALIIEGIFGLFNN